MTIYLQCLLIEFAVLQNFESCACSLCFEADLFDAGKAQEEHPEQSCREILSIWLTDGTIKEGLFDFIFYFSVTQSVLSHYLHIQTH